MLMGDCMPNPLGVVFEWIKQIKLSKKGGKLLLWSNIEIVPRIICYIIIVQPYLVTNSVESGIGLSYNFLFIKGSQFWWIQKNLQW